MAQGTRQRNDRSNPKRKAQANGGETEGDSEAGWRSAQDAIFKIRGYADEGYEWAVQLDLSKYFDTLNHEKLLNLLRETIKDERVIQLIKKFLKSGAMENGVKIATTEGSPRVARCHLYWRMCT